MEYSFSADGSPESCRLLETGESIRFISREVRRERTGVHALVAIAHEDTALAHSTFNIGRSEDRSRLAKAAAKMLTPVVTKDYSLQQLTHDLDVFCLGLGAAWEEQRFTEDLFDVDDPIEPLRRVLWPYVIEGGGTIFFGPPGGGKSYLGLTMALSIGAGVSRLWRVDQPRPILFVNLERDGASMKRRLQLLCHIFGIHGTAHRVTLLNARGQSLAAVERKARAFMAAHNDGVLFVDSISRAGQGSLVDDETANRIVDLLNRVCRTWVAIGHSPRADQSHLYGSIHFEAGEDIGVKVAAEKRGNTLGIALEMVKANDVAFAPICYLALEFNESPDDPDDTYLSNIRKATAREFPELASGRALSRFEKIRGWLEDNGPASAREIDKALRIGESHVTEVLRNNPNAFRFVEKRGASSLYDVVDRSEAP